METPQATSTPLHGRVAAALAVLAFFALTIGLVAGTGNFSNGLRQADEFQIYELHSKAEDAGYLRAAGEYLYSKTFVSKRFIPVHLLQNLACILLYGSNLTLWYLHTTTVGALACSFLYFACRRMGFRVVEAAGLVVFTVVGEQSVIWWRQFNGENTAFLLLAIALYGLVRGAAPNAPARWNVLFIAAATLSALAKESFIVMLPALAVWRLWLVHAHHGLPLRDALRRDRNVYLALGAVLFAIAAFIGGILRTTSYHYAGYRGFEIDQFASIVADTFSPGRAWLLWLAAAATLIAHRRGSVKPATPYALLGPLAIAALILVPQWLLYMRSGYSGSNVVDMERYLIPAMLGVSFLTFALIRRLRESAPANRTASVAAAVLIAGVAAMGLHQFTVAWADGKAYSERVAKTVDFFDRIAAATTEDSQITVVYSVVSFREARRVSIRLQEVMNRPNLVFLPVPFDQSLDAFYDGVEKQMLYGDIFEQPIVDGSVAGADPIHAKSEVVLTTRDDLVEPLNELPWFDKTQYEAFDLELYRLTAFVRKPPAAPAAE